MKLTHNSGFLIMDDSTCAHLDLLPIHGRDPSVSLYGFLNVTCTPMGARLLGRWIARPLQDIAEIRQGFAISSFIIPRRIMRVRSAFECRDLNVR